MRFIYIGAPEDKAQEKGDSATGRVTVKVIQERGDGPDVLRLFGHEFPKGEAIELDEALLPRGVSLDMAVKKLSGNTHFVADSDDREALVKEAEARGLKVHHKAGADKIRAMIEEHDRQG